jgi:hypothetical protein
MDNKNNKSPIIISVFAIAILSVFILVDYKSETGTLTKSKLKLKLKPNGHAKSKEVKSPTRSIASIKDTKRNIPLKKINKDDSNIIQDRKVVGSSSRKYTLVNKINKDWKKLATKKLVFTWGHKIGRIIEIDSIKPAIYVKHGIGKNVEHVRIGLTDENGKHSGYEAYIDSESGSIIQTWNRTRYEINKRVSANAKGKGFVGNALNYKESK